MSKAKREWRVDHLGNLVMSMSVEVNGRVAVAQVVQSEMERMHGGPPPRYIDRMLRRQLMAHIEDELLGPEQ